MSATKPAVSFLGLGAMGFGMASHLVKQGYPVTGFDVYGPTLEKFKATGASVAPAASDAVREKSFCVCMVATAQQAQAVLLDGDNPAVPALPKGATLLLCSTVPAGYVRELQKQISVLGRGDVNLIDCPVSGGAYRAAEGTLTIMAGASDQAVAAGRFLLEELSDSGKLYIVKGGLGAGSNMKMCHQVLAANQILAASEAIGFATHLGLDLPKVGDAITNSIASSWMFSHRLPRILHPQFLPLVSALNIIVKDTAIITSEASNHKFPTPMSSTAEQVYFTGIGRGYGPDDDGGIVRIYTEGYSKSSSAVSARSESDRVNMVISLLKGIHLCSVAEMLAFARSLRLDPDQVLNLCVSAAGGSAILEKFGRDIVKTLSGEKPAAPTTAADRLFGFSEELQGVVNEARVLKVPLFLGSQALYLMRLALQYTPRESRSYASAASIVDIWVSKP